jgi:hypothetical protein
LAKPPQYLCHPGPANAEVAGESSTILKLARVEQRLVVAGKFQRVAGFLRSGRNLRFWFAGTVPGNDLDNRRST